MTIIDDNDNDNDDDIFDDSIDVVAIAPKRKLQRDLLGNIIDTYEPITPQSKPIDHPTHHDIDYNNLKTYIYPINYEIRDYQFNIIEKSFYNNMLVALPTGLGKTFIAATVILNYYRWFPQGKIIFMAPTKPLVAQQVKACFDIIGLRDQFAILLDKAKKNRQPIWDEKQIFFTTPQVVENDLTAGLINPKLVSLLIIDEAHKSKGNYAYNNVVKFLNRFNNSFRILALTATPSATVEGIKEIIDNLSITKIEIRTENSIDIIKYFKNKRIDKVDMDFQSHPLISDYLIYLSNALESLLNLANQRHLTNISNPLSLNSFQLFDVSRRNLANRQINDGIKWSNHFLIKTLMFGSNCIKKLKIYGIKNFANYFIEYHQKNYINKKSKNKLLNDFFKDENIIKLMSLIQNVKSTDISHPKIEILIDYIKNFFKTSTYETSKIIIFTEYRESALEIVTTIESLNDKDLAPHIFIGQAPESNSGVDMPSSPNSKKSSSEDAKLKGMNQKVQKQLIKDFKGSKYNILVATSIGEEGLDIGEVDLIVCYDCTSSPIKNIQRLGRTGRKRDGNILMLFADNERKKFDKAMDNYEFIQSYIMKNESDLVQDSPPNRMIPKNIKPSLEKIFIEPNNDLANEDDNDEIIKIATAYMKNSGSQKLKSKANPKEKNAKSNQKIQKQFFMPDNVETGFQNVSTMVKKKNHVKSVAEEKESDKLFDISNIMSSSSPSNSSQIQITSSQNMPDTEVKKQKSTLNSEQGSSGIDIVQFDSDEDSSLAIINNSSGNIKQKTDSKIQNEQEIKDDGHKEEDDSFDFDDGLDVDLVNLGKDSSEPPKKIIKLDKKVNSKSKDKNTTNDDDDDDKLTSNSFEPKDGVLTSQEKTDFYTNYYSPYVNQKFYEPIVTSSYPTNSNKTKLLQKINNLKELTPQQGQEIIAQYNVQASKISRS